MITLNNREDILNYIPKNSIGAEVGVLYGDFSEKILQIIQPSKLYLIDAWTRFNTKDHLSDCTTQVSQEEQDLRYENILIKFESQIKSNQIQVIRDHSLNAINQFEDNSLDWIYLDANHSYNSIMSELIACYPKVKANGIICGDDYCPINQLWKVFYAVNDFCKNNNLPLELAGSYNQFLFIKKDY